MSPTSDSPPALSATASASAQAAFLRGIERRAFVLLWAQCGDVALAEAALPAVMAAFHEDAAHLPLSAWPVRFWSLLLAQPGLAKPRVAQTQALEPELAVLPAGPRIALLLRLVAGLDFAHAAQVLAVSEDSYRYALRHALQQLETVGVSEAAGQALCERLLARVKTLPETRQSALATMRQAALDDTGPANPTVSTPANGWRRGLWIALALLLALLVVSYLRPGLFGLADSTPDHPLPLPALPTHSLADSDVVMHPDYPQLAHPEQEALAQDLGFYSWLAAGAPAAESTGTIPTLPEAAESSAGAAPDDETRRELPR